MKAAFLHFDKEGKGKISAKEIKQTLSAGGKKFGGGNEIWKQILKEADEDGDGHITFPEFTKMMNQFIRASEMIDRLTLQSNVTITSQSSKKKLKEAADAATKRLSNVPEENEDNGGESQKYYGS